jgi:hypothetical protein
MATHRFFTSLFVCSAFVIACSDDPKAQTSDDGGGGDGNGAAVGGGGAGQGGDPSGGNGSGGFNATQSGGNGSGGEMTCLEEEAIAEERKLNMLVVLDRSASMGMKWDQSVAALTTYFNDPAANGIAAALNYFPQAGVVDSCNVNHYNPPDVPFGDLNAYAATLVASMQATTAQGPDTPMYGALYGSYQYAQMFQDSVPDEVVAVVFASDGEPNGCQGNQNDPTVVAQLASDTLAYNGVRTFAIAIQGADINALDLIAAAGGTTQAIDVTMDTTLFAAAMEDIQKQVLSCEFDIPDPQMGNFDPTKVNVKYTPGGGGPAQDIPQASDLADCGGMPGWYYDDPDDPTQILLCPATCDLVQSDPDAQVTFAFGCPTILN